MALFWAYVPEPDEMAVLLATTGPASREEMERREDRLTVGYVELQAYCSRNPGLDRYVTRAEAMECLHEDWVLDALCAPLPARSPLLHTPGGPGTMCLIEGCLDRCFDEGCDCSIGMWREGAWHGTVHDRTDFRVCLTR